MAATIIGSLADTLDHLSLMGEQMGPEFARLIDQDLPRRAQRIMDMRLRRCYRHCRRSHYDIHGVVALVDLDFPDLRPALQAEVITLITAQLKAAK